MPLTFQEVQDSSIPQVANVCNTSPEFALLINDAVRRLMRRGDWPSATQPIFVCVRNGCIVWPRYVGQIRKVNICSHPMPVHNLWWEFMSGAKDRDCSTWGSRFGHEASLQAYGRTSVFQDVQGDGRLIRAYPRCLNDIGKLITIFGTDNNGQPLQERDSANNWVPGVSIQLANPFGSTSVYVRSIDYVVKAETQCIVDMYAYNVSTNLLEDLAHYEPTETSPSYERTKVNVSWPNTCTAFSTPNCCSAQKGVVALVKLKFIPVKYGTDLVLIDNIDALELEVQAIQFQKAGDRANYKSFETDAISELNRDVNDVTPDDQFPAAPNILGPRVWSNRVF